MNDFEVVLRILGLALLVIGAAVVILASWVLVTGRRPTWVRRRQTLTEAYVRWWAAPALTSGLAAMAIGGPYIQGYPVHGAGQWLQAAGFALLLAGAGCWGVIIARSGYTRP